MAHEAAYELCNLRIWIVVFYFNNFLKKTPSSFLPVTWSFLFCDLISLDFTLLIGQTTLLNLMIPKSFLSLTMKKELIT